MDNPSPREWVLNNTLRAAIATPESPHEDLEHDSVLTVIFVTAEFSATKANS